MAKANVEPWFGGKTETILLYRVNRRPLAVPNLFSRQPEDVLDHFSQVLLFGQTFVTGTRNRRIWILGNRRIDETDRTLAGQIGWHSEVDEIRSEFDGERNEWIDAPAERGRSARATFAFDALTRTLGVLHHPSFSEKTIPKVFVGLLT